MLHVFFIVQVLFNFLRQERPLIEGFGFQHIVLLNFQLLCLLLFDLFDRHLEWNCVESASELQWCFDTLNAHFGIELIVLLTEVELVRTDLVTEVLGFDVRGGVFGHVDPGLGEGLRGWHDRYSVIG